MDAPIPVTVVSGFLGAGKTTLVNRWLEGHARGEIAVVVNEHGEIGIDGALLAERVRTLIEITGGCVCCATHGELVRALAELSRKRPARILVETSGAASPAGVLRAIGAGDASVVLDGVVTIVDPTRIAALEEHDLAIEQIGFADVVVLSRADLCGPEELEHARATVAAWNEAAVVAASGHGSTAPTLATLLEARTELAPRAAPRAGGHRHVYESISLASDGEVDGDRFADFVEEELARFAGRILRTKGVLAVAGVDERMIVQGVADRIEITFGARWGTEPRRSRFVVIGFGLDREALAARFAACACDRSPFART
jgi:G3E family GTPase